MNIKNVQLVLQDLTYRLLQLLINKDNALFVMLIVQPQLAQMEQVLVPVQQLELNVKETTN